MNGDFVLLIEKLKEYEKEIVELWKEYNAEDSGLKLELLAMKMSVVFYKYMIACFETLNDVTKDKMLDAARFWLTAISYGLTGISIFKAPNITLPSLLGCFYLSVKNRRYYNLKIILTDDQANELLDLLDSFEDTYASRIDEVFEQIDRYEDDQYIEKLDEPEKSKRIACKKLMQFLRQEDNQLLLENDVFVNNLYAILNESLQTENTNLYEMLQEALVKYQELDNYLTKLDKRDNHLSRVYRIIG